MTLIRILRQASSGSTRACLAAQVSKQLRTCRRKGTCACVVPPEEHVCNHAWERSILLPAYLSRPPGARLVYCSISVFLTASSCSTPPREQQSDSTQSGQDSTHHTSFVSFDHRVPGIGDACCLCRIMHHASLLPTARLPQKLTSSTPLPTQARSPPESRHAPTRSLNPFLRAPRLVRFHRTT